jgi:hypothetical protein
VFLSRKEGSAFRWANDNALMDVKGAQELARVLTLRHGTVPKAVRAAPLNAEDAAPIFHWLGIEPPDENAAAGSSESQ